MSKNLYQKMTDIMKDVQSVFKGATIQMGNNRSYSAVNHDDVARLLHKPLADAGIVTKVSVERAEITQGTKTNKYGDQSAEYRADVWVEVTFINADKPEEREVCKSFAYAFDSGDKAVGKAESMAVKYVFLKNFVLESTDNEESRDHELTTKVPAKKNLAEEIETKKATRDTPPPQQETSTAAKKTVGFAKKPQSTQVVANNSADDISL
jgi:hypothetical protein